MNDGLNGTEIVFVGAGSMAEAMVRGLLENDITEPSRLTVLNRRQSQRLDQLQDKYGVRTAVAEDEKRSAVRRADIVVLAMKPADAAQAIAGLRGELRPSQLLVSVIAGLSCESIIKLAEQEIPLARTMPNTSSTIGLGATGVSFTSRVSPEQRRLALTMLRAIGILAEVREPLLDVVTGVSGSGPAYIYAMMEAMIGAGIEGGLEAEAARRLTVQTVLGAARMVETSGEDPAELRRKVTSPGGTTQAALELMEQNGFSETVRKAVLRAAERSRELGDAIARSIQP